MPVHNAEIAELFNRLADLLEVEDANPFRVRAYRNAARTVSSLTRNISDLVSAGENLTELPGIGEALAKKIETIVKAGKLPQLEKVEARTPPALSKLMKIEGLGPKRVKTLYKKLRIDSLEDLERAARSGKIRALEGFGKKTEELILQRTERFSGVEQRMKLLMTEDFVEPLVAYLKESQGVKDITVAGSFRRRKETVGDLDILVAARKDSPVMDRFVDYDEVDEVVSQGTTRSTVILRSGLHVDLRVVPQVSYGAALCYFTGSKAHNIAVRKIGVKQGYKINEYGAFRGDLETIITAAKKRGCFLEVNAQPDRLDLTDTYCKLAKEIGVKVAISTDAHRTGNLDYMRFGISQARRGWLEADDVLNTRGLEDLKALL